jgi:site-specific recombinase XerD
MRVAKAEQLKLPTLGEVQSFWKRNGLKASTIVVYSSWVRRFTKTFEHREKECPVNSLTAAKVHRFACRYARGRHLDSTYPSRAACHALHAWAAALSTLGVVTPAWKEAARKRSRFPLLEEYLVYRKIHGGASTTREQRDLADISEWLRFLSSRRKSIAKLRLKDVDDYLILLRKRLAIATVSTRMSSLRQFIRFLHVTGRLRFDLTEAIQSPKRRPTELPRALPWPTVRKILHCIDRKTATGRRDFSVLLLMSLYGLGALMFQNSA